MSSLPDRRRVAYYYDPNIGMYSYSQEHCMKPHRVEMTHSLVSAYGMLDKMHVLRPSRASTTDMARFHTDEYVNFLSKVTPLPSNMRIEDDPERHRFLVGSDNPAFEGLFEFCSISAGGSMAAANRIASGTADIAINWAGGLHHAKKREASGFCYINDIVLGILELLRTYPRVLYIDIDCHHGDGVEEAFYQTNRVMTCSFHKFGEYFPGSGDLLDRGYGKGKGYAVNVPLKDGITDERYADVFVPIVTKILSVFRPSAVVLQCGSDSLANDKLGCFNLSMEGHAACVQFLRRQNIPLILLGGGGYTVRNVARTWCYETACALGVEYEIDKMLPYNEYFEWFTPRYRLEVPSSNMDNENTKDLVEEIRAQVLQNLSELEHAPSVQMQDTPRESVAQHLGLSNDEDEAEKDESEEAWKSIHPEDRTETAPDALDHELAQHTSLIYKLQCSSLDSEDEAALNRFNLDDSDDSDSDMTLTNYPRKRRLRETKQKSKKKWPPRMSIVTNRPILEGWNVWDDVEEQVQKRTKRRFFC